METKLKQFLSRNALTLMFHLVFTFLFMNEARIASILYVLVGSVLGVYFLVKRRTSYVTFLLWLYYLSPFFRRLSDYQLGDRNDRSLVLIMPIVVSCLPIALTLFRKYTPRFTVAMAAFLAAISYGLVVAVLRGNLINGAYDFLCYLGPFATLLYMVNSTDDRKTYENELIGNFVVFLLVCGTYGIYQFASFPIWDKQWLLQAGFATGELTAGDFRIFGTLNSPGPFAVSLTYAICFILLVGKVKDFWQFLAVAIGVFALLLTQVRSSMIALVLILVLGARVIPKKTVFALALAIFAALAIGLSTLAEFNTSEKISSRLESFFNPSSDASIRIRLRSYFDFLDQIEAAPLGAGLGAGGAAETASSVEVPESGLSAKLVTLGPIFALVFYFATLQFLSLFWTPKRVDIAFKSLLVAFFFIELFGNAFLSIRGNFLFMTLGLMYLR